MKSIGRHMRAKTIGAISIAVLCLMVTAPARGETSARDIQALQQSSLIYIATVRKDGNQSKSTPVWFITTKDHQVLIETSPTSWKAKRIRRGSPAMIWIGKSDGPAFIGKAEITTDQAVLDQIIGEYPHKYLAARVGFFRPTQERFDSGKICAIRITPMRDFPDGFASAPATPAPKLDAAPAAASQ
ncbi:MAG: pyridoxamine 5'-phosphate oxidase family protein [Candidatus Binataceae bacterium]